MGKVDVPGVEEEDLDIKIDDGRITVEGQRMMVSSNEASRFTSKFSKTFSLDPTVDVDMFTASLNNGVLVVSAKDSAKLEQNPPDPHHGGGLYRRRYRCIGRRYKG